MRKGLQKAVPGDRDWKGDHLEPGQDYVEVRGEKYGVLPARFICSPDGGDFRRVRHVEIGGQEFRVIEQPTGAYPEPGYIEFPG